MRSAILSFAFLFLFTSASKKDWRTPHEKKGENYSSTYREAIDFYQTLDAGSDQLKLLTYGMTDAGKPLHLAVISTDKDFDPESIRRHNRRIILVINNIHPGEPEGVDASMALARDILENRNKLKDKLQDVVLAIIPMYNIGGALNRGCCSRANQNGPDEYGFRGNAQNLDLNRDFIKCDSRNARAFTEIYQTWQPDILVDNHTSNGADYQYTLTCIANHPESLNKSMGSYLHGDLMPYLSKQTETKGYPIAPYVETLQELPDSGIVNFSSTPRYSTGYASLYNAIAFTVETHMWKAFPERLKATYAFMEALLEKTAIDKARIGELRAKALYEMQALKKYTIRWDFDPSRKDSVMFLGYEAGYKPSRISGQQRLYYDRNKPYKRYIPYYQAYKAEITVDVPQAYIIPQAWWRCIELLKLNRVDMAPLPRDTILNAEVYIIMEWEDRSSRPYEGHYLHKSVKVEKQTQKLQFHEGDLLIKTAQPAMRYVLETLEPQSEDSYFSWNFFDAILQQKEYFSSYVFEERAEELLKNDAALRKELENKRMTDTSFSRNGYAQLDLIYKRSGHFEPSYRRYPVARLMYNFEPGK